MRFRSLTRRGCRIARDISPFPPAENTQIRKLAEQPLQIRLAISLHGATDAVRDRIMPINKRYPVATLFEACRNYTARKKQRLTFEYILIAGVNDSDEQARELTRRVRELQAKVNLILTTRLKSDQLESTAA